MTAPDSPSRRRRGRLALFAPFLLLGVLILLISLAWWRISGMVMAQLASAQSGAAGSGWRLGYSHVRCSGFPFRIDLDIAQPQLSDAAGWGLEAGELKAEAFIFSPGHWVVVAPAGIVIQRPQNGPLFVAARVLRASISEAQKSPPRLSVEGRDLIFSTLPGSPPLLLQSASELHLHSKSGPNDQGAAYVEIDGAKAHLNGLIARVAAGGPISLVADGIYSRAGALSGGSVPAAFRSWSQAGGELQLRRLTLSAGQARIDARPGVLQVGPTGRLVGQLNVSLRQADQWLGGLAESGALSPQSATQALRATGAEPVATVPLSFANGRTRLGPADVGASPKLF